MSKTSETLFPGEYSRSEATQNLNDLVRESSFAPDAIGLAMDLASHIEKKIFLIGMSSIDSMSELFTLCNDYETRYQAIIKKALDEALAKVRAKNDLQEVTWEFPSSSNECIGGVVISCPDEEHKGFVALDENTAHDFIPDYDLKEPIHSPQIYFGDWKDEGFHGMVRQFEGYYDGHEKIKDAITLPKYTSIKVLFAWYLYECYSGNAFVLFEKNGKLYEVNGSHCSCNGIEGQWEPEETTIEALRKRFKENINYGWRGEVWPFIQPILQRLKPEEEPCK